MALPSASPERNEFEQTSSAKCPVLCTAVERTGRISCSTTGTPRRATCQADSEPARPPPITWTGDMRRVIVPKLGAPSRAGNLAGTLGREGVQHAEPQIVDV